jgi:hypothetical protein
MVVSIDEHRLRLSPEQPDQNPQLAPVSIGDVSAEIKVAEVRFGVSRLLRCLPMDRVSGGIGGASDRDHRRRILKVEKRGVWCLVVHC